MKRLLKTAAKKCYLAFQRKKRETKTFMAARRHLRKGIYYFPFGKGKIIPADWGVFHPLNIFHIHINLAGTGGETFLDFGTGYGKTVVMTRDKAYGYYYTDNGYEASKKNMQAYFSDFNYPCMAELSFHDELKCVQMERICGRVFNDYTHDKNVINGMIKCLTEAKTRQQKNGKIYFLQHGDASQLNVLWDEGGNYKFIDLDNMNYYPALLDVFHYCCTAGYTLEKIVAFLKEDKAAVEKICERAEIDVRKNYIDELFFGYATHYLRMGICYDDIAFLKSCLKSDEYPKTKELLKGKI